MVPYRKKAPAANTIRLQSTIINSGRGITTIQLSPVDSSKKKEGKGGKGGSLAQKSAGGREGRCVGVGLWVGRCMCVLCVYVCACVCRCGWV